MVVSLYGAYAPTAFFANEMPEETVNEFGSFPLSSEGDQFDDELDAAE